MKDKKVILLVSVIFVSALLLAFTVFKLLKNEDGEKGNGSLTAYGVVVEKGSNYLLVEGVDNERYYVAYTSDDINTGTFVSVSYQNESEKKAGKGIVDVVLNNDEIKIVDDLTTTTVASFDEDEKVSTTTMKKTNKATNQSTTTNAKMTTTTQYRYTTKFNENDIVAYASSTYSDIENNKSALDSAKEGFITLVDFIFYDGTIKGKKFSELTSSAKAKVIYYTLLIDGAIDSKWPNYKENIQSKYHDIKDKLVAKYLDITTSICESSSDSCEQAKSDFKLLKESVKLTWNTLKNAFSYAYNKGKDALVSWYEIFSGKK